MKTGPQDHFAAARPRVLDGNQCILAPVEQGLQGVRRFSPGPPVHVVARGVQFAGQCRIGTQRSAQLSGRLQLLNFR